MIELTEELLRIPRALAHRYSRGDPNLRDELLSDGYLALLQAARSYRPGRGTRPSSWLYGCVRLRLLGSLRPKAYGQSRRWAEAESLDRPAPDGRETFAAILPDWRPDPREAVDARDLWAACVRRLPGAQAEALRLVVMGGATYRDAGARLGLSRQMVWHVLRQGIENARRLADGEEA